ncbi:MAG: leucyl aminopeptidase family protein [Rickettsiales bacterium]|jgi:leucyl aminopeptidase
MPHFFPIITKSKTKSTPIILLTEKTFYTWKTKQYIAIKNWLDGNDFTGKAGSFLVIPDNEGKITQIVAVIEYPQTIWSIAHLPTKIPSGIYHLEGELNKEETTNLALGWSLATYEFIKYKKSSKKFPQLVAPKNCDIALTKSFFESICWARDLINTPANDMNPETLANEAVMWANSLTKTQKAKITIIKGEDLLKENYPMIYTVGKAATIEPRLVDISFPRKNAPKITLVGKGVTFDSGGLDIKSTGGMKMMKKDMGGAANILALARVIMEMELPIQLRILLPIVENSIAGNAMRPLDIVPTRKGINVEIGNTDAEGRLILCDAIFEADSETPDLLIDCATLTGAARVALGTEVPAFFTNDDKLANKLAKISDREDDPLWRLPLWKGYRSQLETENADLSNDPDSSYGGAITAALYLQEFIIKTSSWIHVDMMAWNLQNKAGRPKGGEAMGIRALYTLIKENYGSTR